MPAVNHRIAGEEADLVWTGRRLIVEIDGPQVHLLPEEDARRPARWEASPHVLVRLAEG